MILISLKDHIAKEVITRGAEVGLSAEQVVEQAIISYLKLKADSPKTLRASEFVPCLVLSKAKDLKPEELSKATLDISDSVYTTLERSFLTTGGGCRPMSTKEVESRDTINTISLGVLQSARMYSNIIFRLEDFVREVVRESYPTDPALLSLTVECINDMSDKHSVTCEYADSLGYVIYKAPESMYV